MIGSDSMWKIGGRRTLRRSLGKETTRRKKKKGEEKEEKSRNKLHLPDRKNTKILVIKENQKR